MEYRKLGDTAIEVSAIAFGAWAIGGWMWGGTERKEAVSAIKASYDQGVTTIDTAPIYGQGLSEEIVGEALQGIPRDQVQLLTKFGMRWDAPQGIPRDQARLLTNLGMHRDAPKGDFAFKSTDNAGRDIDTYKYAGKESIIKECEDSLRRLQTDYIDLYQLHWPDITTPIEESMEAVARLLQQGKIRAAGVSNYNALQMQQAAAVVHLASNQVPYSMVERSIEQMLVPYCLEHHTSIIAYSPLQRGLLTGKIKPGHQFASGDHRAVNSFYQPWNIESVNHFLDKLRPMAAGKGISLSQLVLRWTIDQPGITVALAGARNAEQAIQNAKASQVEISAEEMRMINSLLQQLELVV